MAVAKSDAVNESVDPSTRSFHLEIFLMSFAALLLEIAYTRIVSYKLSYYYTYLVIGLALLGIGSGGVFVAISGRLRRASTDAIVMWGLITGGVSVGIGYVIVALIRTNSIAIFDYGARSRSPTWPGSASSASSCSRPSCRSASCWPRSSAGAPRRSGACTSPTCSAPGSRAWSWSRCCASSGRRRRSSSPACS